MKTPEEKKAAQAVAHRKWRQSERGKAWVAAYKQGSKYKADQIRLQEQRKKPDEPTS
jgi:hypothetical protein